MCCLKEYSGDVQILKTALWHGKLNFTNVSGLSFAAVCSLSWESSLHSVFTHRGCWHPVGKML